MIFKKGTDTKAVNNAYFATFIFWGFALLINSIFEIYHKEFISSLYILIAGLIIFFLTEYITKKSQAEK
jgi:energy-coupling factor transporter transmembrane protein EcfT